ncbi:hypothetical protein AZE42_11046, partial [Rhizopogon vesiculosus]
VCLRETKGDYRLPATCYASFACLLLTEILLDIFTAIREDPQRLHPRATIAALAITCRTFKEPALGVVARLSRTLWLVRPLSIGDWGVFARYAPRIQSLTVDRFELDKISDPRVQQALTSSSALLPNLRSLLWTDNQDRFLPLLHTLLGAGIRSLTLHSDLYYKPWGHPTPAKSILLASIGARCPSIQEFDCEYGNSEESSRVVLKAVCGWHKLVHLSTGALNPQALAHLASLPSLRSLHFVSYDDFDADMQSNCIPTFAFKLDKVSITVPSHSHHIRRLRNVRFLSCRSTALYIDRRKQGLHHGPVDVPDLVISFSECFSPNIDHVKPDEGVLDDHRFAFGFGMVAPLLQFSRLTKLDLNWLCTSDVDDEALKTIVQFWPQLEEFYFGGGCDWLIMPHVSFTGLVHLIQHCQRLSRIKMRFSACPIDTDTESFSTTIPNEKLTYLFVGISPIVDPIVVACQLNALLPNLAHVTRSDYYDFLLCREPPFADEWDKVDQYLQLATSSH